MTYKFLIYISYSYAIPIGDPLEKEILRQGYDVKWFADLPEGNAAISNKKNALKSINAVLDYKPHIVLAATDSVPDFIPALRVQVFHGFNAQKRPSKKHTFSHFRIRGFFDLYCTQGPSTTKGFLAKQKEHPHFEVIETGWSKVDPLFPLSVKPVNEYPMIFIASTFTERLSLAYNDSVFEEIKRLSEKGEFQFSMVLHPKIERSTVQKWKSLESEKFSFFETTNLIPLFENADIMFSDTTSAIQEFILQEKPVVAYNHTFPHKYLIHVNTVETIEASLKLALTCPTDIIQNIKEFIKELHPYYDGHSSERIIKASISFLHAEKQHLKSKPLNLMRKYKIRKRLNYFTLKSFNRPFTIKDPS
ncbi:MAG: CDP-glycerol glycerophosphotransferase [Bacteroidia bacterium]|nr:CDP-glycerol glycerophosphotransferase [Bacteroidia bacterium]NND26546.1 CDP-glycerol glycerophosphotransferase [Flavobacteriaceae bacterium]MBT8278356.1 CDP-glycerol glycerophosphotransferase [Bacteroidia bacterium]NNK60103.1 CDP-glycerol glycerophosphotransferase [Flavobacteriaceae bacterium]NNL32150.1 CDP-glycerol glycerophosphotransferase [Flavobacteriaceae bacterium]